MTRKFIYYLRGFSRTIVITDKDDDVPHEQLIAKISNAMSGTQVSKFDTGNDILLVRPSDIVAVHIMNESQDSNHDDSVNAEESEIQLQSVIPEIDLGELDESKELDILEDVEIPVEETSTEEECVEEDVGENANDADTESG